MFSKRGITFKAVILLSLISTSIFLIDNIYSYFVSRSIIIDQAKENSVMLGSNVAHQLTSRIKPIENLIDNIAATLENSDLTSEAITDLTRSIVGGSETIFGSAIAFEPYGKHKDQLFFAPYSHLSKDGLSTKMLGSTDYRYFYLDWYQLAQKLGKGVWTDPYNDTGGGDVLMSTYTAPFYQQRDGKRVFTGVVTADISLEWIQKTISAIKLYETGYAAMLSKSGSFIYHPKENLILNETIFSLADELEDHQLWNVGRDLVQGKSGFEARDSLVTGEKNFFHYMPLPVGGWSLVFLFPEAEVLAHLTRLTRDTMFISLSGFCLLIIAITLLTKKLTRPLINLAESAREIAKGNLDADVPVLNTSDELGQLTVAFRDMEQSLKDHIEQLTTTTAQKERIESELRIAREIQMSILPKIFPPFPDCDEIDLYASIEPAREIGGDLYDFFFIDENRFCFLIGDVSDKGVPAAFFMAVTKTLLKIIAEQSPDPGAILTKVNDDLSVGNDSCMFVTLFLGILDIRTGVIQTGNAGHNPPVLLANGKVEYLPSINEPIAGAMEGIEYSTQELVLAEGDSLFLYTDGVTEAMNTSAEFYSEERLLDKVRANKKEDPNLQTEKLVKNIESSIDDFTQGAEQSDDITMLCLRFKGQGK